MANMIYDWRLTYGGATYVVHPVYKDDMTLNYELEPNQRFFRQSLSGNIVFVGAEARKIIAAAFDTEFVVEVYCSTDNGHTWALLHRGKFFMTDCKIDDDNDMVTVKSSVKDAYDIILDGLEKEFNLIDLLPVTEKIRMKRRALLQIYDAGDNKVTNIFGGFSWETDFDIGTHDIANDLHFNENFGFYSIGIMKDFATAEEKEGLKKAFFCQPDENGEFDVTNGCGYYKLKRVRVGDSWDLRVIRLSDDVIESFFQNDNIRIPVGGFEFQYYPNPSFFPWGHGAFYYKSLYVRWLCDVPSFSIGSTQYTTYKLASYDPNYGGNLNYCIGWNVTLVSSEEVSEEPTEWGKMDDTYYYQQPQQSGYYIPVGRSYWDVSSIWYKQTPDEYVYAEPAMQKEYYLRDSYPLWSVLQVLLTAVGSDVTFGNTSEYSEFFYSQYNPITGMSSKPYITPKSNILVGEYTQPAMKAPITLQDVFQMLAKAYKCYWFIDNENRLRVEHITWFKNGGTYSGVHQVGMDITALMNVRNRKMWSFDTSSWQYDKQDMPARYQYKWMDAGTDIFDGWAYEMQSPFVKTDKVEEITVSNFTSDVDFMQIAPNDCSKDGFALMMVAVDNGTNYLPIVQIERGAWNRICHYVVQNYYASMHALQKYILKYDLPAWHYKWDGAALTAPDIMRGKRQTVNIPYAMGEPDVMKLVRTGIGDGQVQSLQLNLSSRMAKATILYDTCELNNE